MERQLEYWKEKVSQNSIDNPISVPRPQTATKPATGRWPKWQGHVAERNQKIGGSGASDYQILGVAPESEQEFESVDCSEGPVDPNLPAVDTKAVRRADLAPGAV